MPDLETNLRLNDSQFKQGLARADAALGRFDNRLKSLGKSSNMVANALRFGGASIIAAGIIDGFDRMIERQSRIIEGTESIRDKWEETQGILYTAAGIIPIIGSDLQKVAFHLQGGTEAVTKIAGEQGLARIRREQEGLFRQLKAKDKLDREQIRLQDEHLKRVEAIGREAAKAGVAAKDMLDREKEIFKQQQKGALQTRQLQAGQAVGSPQQFRQFFGNGAPINAPAPQVTAPGGGLPLPGPTTPPAAIKAQEDTARNTRETANLLSRLVNRQPSSAYA